LRRFLAARLPDYMVPSVFVPLEAMPRTPNGKVNRRGLPQPDRSAPKSGDDHVAPSNPREHQLAEICAEVLALDRVSVRDSIFDLGADSIHVFQIVARANDVGIPLTPKQVLSGRSVSAINAEVDRQTARPAGGTPQLAPASREQYRVPRSRLS